MKLLIILQQSRPVKSIDTMSNLMHETSSDVHLYDE